MEDKEYEFVHETIKKKPVNKKKLLRRTVLTAALAVVFGLVACVTFLLIEPVINNVLNPEKISKVEFPEEKKEVKPQELLTEESVARQEVQRQEAAVEEAKEEAIQSATTAFGIVSGSLRLCAGFHGFYGFRDWDFGNAGLAAGNV